MVANGRVVGALCLGWALSAQLLLPATSQAMAPVRQGPPGIVVANDGMSCAGSLIQLGDSPDRVLHLCGAPTTGKHWLLRWRTKAGVATSLLDIWRYERYGSLPRLLRFENGLLVSLAAVSPFYTASHLDGP